MVLEKENFVKYNTGPTVKNVLSMKMNTDEWQIINDAKFLLHQTKSSTVAKTLMKFGMAYLNKPENKYLINTIFKNNKNNARNGIAEFD